MKKHVITCLLRLPASLNATVTELGKEDGTTMNRLAAKGFAQKVPTMRTAEFLAARGDAGGIDAARRPLRRDGAQPPEPGDRLT